VGDDHAKSAVQPPSSGTSPPSSHYCRGCVPPLARHGALTPLRNSLRAKQQCRAGRRLGAASRPFQDSGRRPPTRSYLPRSERAPRAVSSTPPPPVCDAIGVSGPVDEQTAHRLPDGAVCTHPRGTKTNVFGPCHHLAVTETKTIYPSRCRSLVGVRMDVRRTYAQRFLRGKAKVAGRPRDRRVVVCARIGFRG
jgi:hypothetical protein